MNGMSEERKKFAVLVMVNFTVQERELLTRMAWMAGPKGTGLIDAVYRSEAAGGARLRLSKDPFPV